MLEKVLHFRVEDGQRREWGYALVNLFASGSYLRGCVGGGTTSDVSFLWSDHNVTKHTPIGREFGWQWSDHRR